MTTHIGYSLILLADNSEVASVTTLPARIHVPGVIRCDFDKVGQLAPDADNATHKLVDRHIVDRPTRLHQSGIETIGYDGSKTVVDPNWTTVPLADAKATVIAEIKEESARRLRNTDWYVMREVCEPGKPIPVSIKQARKAIRDHSDDLEAEVEALTTVENVAAYQQHDWP